MKHVIKYPDGPQWDPAAELRTIIWDDEAGTVEGDHREVPGMKLVFEHGGQAVLGMPYGTLLLEDVRHNPQDFVSLLADCQELDPRAILPDSLKGIEPLYPPYEPPSPGGIY